MNKLLIKGITWKIAFVIIFITGSISSNYLQAKNIAIKDYSTTITVSKRLSIKELFEFIEAESDFDFFYSSTLKGLDSQVIIDVKNENVYNVLNKAFLGTNLEFTIKGKDIVVRELTQTVSQQQVVKTISGVVYDETGISLPGVNVVVKNGETGSSTDFDGKYSIEVIEGDVLVFSFMGYSDNEVKIGTENTYNVTMQPNASVLDEIILSGVASGVERKKLSVSVSKVNAETLAQAPQSSVSSSLQGKIAGVNVVSASGAPGSGSNIVLRGATNITGGQAPMILVDGVIIQGSLSDINADDVETMEVVKGAAAASLYGSRAGNGVIVITTKRGSSLNDGQTTVTLRNEIGIQQVAKYIELSESHAYRMGADYNSSGTFTNYFGVDYPSNYVSGFDNRVTGNRLLKEDHYMDMPYGVYNNPQDQMFTNGLSYTNYVSVGHRVNQTNIFMSFENNADQGVLVETGGYKRKSFRVNIDHAISENIKISASNNYISTFNDSPVGSSSGSSSIFYSVLAAEPDVDFFRDNKSGQKYNYFPNQWNTRSSNPIYNSWRKSDQTEKSRFLGAYAVNVKLADWVNFKGTYSFESQDAGIEEYTPKDTYIGRKFVDGFDDEGNEKLYIEKNVSDGRISKYSSKIFNQNFRATLNFNHSWGELDFSGKMSYLLEDNHYENFKVTGSGFLLKDYPSLNYFNNDSYIGSDKVEDIVSENYFAIASFIFKDRYIVDGLYRKDGSSLFGENERWNDYFRTSAAYRITKDVEIPGVEELKLRAAYGTSGQRPEFYMQYETYYINDGNLEKGTAGNKDLKPSRSAEFEIGLDASFLDRFRAEVNYSQTKTSDQILKSPMFVPAGGFLYQYRNVAELSSNTIEAMLNVDIMKTTDFSWNATFTFDKTKSEITKLDIPEYKTGPGNAFFIREGEEYGGMYGRDFVRTLDQMKNQLPDGATIEEYMVNADGIVVRSEDLGTKHEVASILKDETGANWYGKIGDINPDFNLSMNTTFKYKAFSFYMLWQWKQGVDMYNMTSQYLVDIQRNGMMDMMYTEQKDKKAFDYYSSLYDGQQINKFWIEDASFVRLKETSLFYTLNKKNLGSVGNYISGMKFGVIARNLLTFTEYSGYDPETSSDGYAYDNYGYPNFRNYSFSFELKF